MVSADDAPGGTVSADQMGGRTKPYEPGPPDRKQMRDCNIPGGSYGGFPRHPAGKGRFSPFGIDPKRPDDKDDEPTPDAAAKKALANLSREAMTTKKIMNEVRQTGKQSCDAVEKKVACTPVGEE